MIPIRTPNNTVQGQLEQKREAKEQFRGCSDALFDEHDAARITAAEASIERLGCNLGGPTTSGLDPWRDPKSLEEYHPNLERAEQNAQGATAAGEFFLPLEPIRLRKQL